MFVQVIRGHVSDAASLRRLMDRWVAEIRPSAEGFLGSTAGVTKDGQGIAIARFEDAAAAQRNSGRPEQGNWWAEMEKVFDGPVTFLDTEDVDTWLDGGSDDAGFVQVMIGTATDRNALNALMAEADPFLRQLRPDLIGSIVSWHDGGTFVEAAYFRSLAEARQGESATPPAEAESLVARLNELQKVDEYLDLEDPWLVS
jgi:hypothetical protein